MDNDHRRSVWARHACVLAACLAPTILGRLPQADAFVVARPGLGRRGWGLPPVERGRRCRPPATARSAAPGARGVQASSSRASELARQVLEAPIEKRISLRKRDVLRSITPETIPWLVTVLVALALSAWFHSLLPAVVMGMVDLIFWGYVTLKVQVTPEIYVLMHAIPLHASRVVRALTLPHHLQDLNRLSPPEPLSRSLEELYDNCLRYSPGGAEDFIRGWFFDAPMSSITRDDVLEWLAWASYTSTWDRLTPKSQEEVLKILPRFEAALQRTLPARREAQEPIPSMRYTIEPLEFTHKPFVYYVVCHGLLGGLGKLLLSRAGFVRARCGVLNYWYRDATPHSSGAAGAGATGGGGAPEERAGGVADGGEDEGSLSAGRTPIVFVHGIGVGLIMYLQFIHAMLTCRCAMVRS